MREVSLQEQNELLAALSEHASELWRRPGVEHIDVGFRMVEGAHTDQLSIRMFVHEKKDTDLLSESDIAPPSLDGIDVDVIRSRKQLQARSGRFKSVAGGVLVTSATAGTHGTLGLIVRDSASGAKLGLSNHHVLRGSPPISEVGDEILQPTLADPRDVIGTLLRWNDQLDCAVAKLNHSREFRLREAIGIEPRVRHIVPPRLGMKVTKSGVLTEVTGGWIDGIGLPGTDLTIAPDPDFPAPFGMSLPGDSGSVWVESNTGDAVGLHYAGEEAGQPDRAWAKRMTEVAGALQFTL